MWFTHCRASMCTLESASSFGSLMMKAGSPCQLNEQLDIWGKNWISAVCVTAEN